MCSSCQIIIQKHNKKGNHDADIAGIDEPIETDAVSDDAVKDAADAVKEVPGDYPDFGADEKAVDPDRQVLPKREHSKLEFPHIEGNEVELEHAKEPDPVDNANNPDYVEAWDGHMVTLIGRGLLDFYI